MTLDTDWEDNVDNVPPSPSSSDDYGILLIAEALLEECLQDNLELLRRATPLTDETQPKLSTAKAHLNTILSRGRLAVRPASDHLSLT